VYAQNLKKIPDYRDRIKAGRLGTERGLRVSDEDKLRRDAITCIMCDLELNLSDFGRRWGIDCDRYFGNSEALLKMEADGLLEVSGDALKVTGTGRLFLRNIAMLFDGYCRSQGGNESLRYSRTV
jgi:oxygen-independent coproporphyrinogen-3 oxidase